MLPLGIVSDVFQWVSKLASLSACFWAQFFFGAEGLAKAFQTKALAGLLMAGFQCDVHHHDCAMETWRLDCGSQTIFINDLDTSQTSANIANNYVSDIPVPFYLGCVHDVSL